MGIDILTYQEALERAGTGTKHLLLGNGFSRACRNELFAYDALYDVIKEDLPPRLQRAFKALRTQDFEVIMRSLFTAGRLVHIYSERPRHDSIENVKSFFKGDISILRDSLAEAISKNHPERPGHIKDIEYQCCRYFLSNFSKIYTLNYDLLLYWVLMHDEIDDIRISCDDGFRKSDEGDKEYVVWDMGDNHSPNIFYLHGALHIYDSTFELQKYTWRNTGIALIDQLKISLDHVISQIRPLDCHVKLSN